ncbi:MAG: response regulator [Marinilabiliales bacterium]|nr:MAG: response regulator [Marinilabiliales bacterium]
MNDEKIILLADDDFDYLFQMRFKLENAGYKVISASSQKEAEELIENSYFDAAIFDLMMENDDSGFVLSYKTKKKNNSIPVIIATAVTSETGISFDKNTEWVKADAFLEKGVEVEKITEILNKYLNI